MNIPYKRLFSETKLGKYHTISDGNPIYWGNQGAGCILHSGRYVLLGLRSAFVNEPGTWGYPGGKIDNNEDPYKAAIRECKEETGIKISDAKPLYTFEDKKNNFKYFTFISELPNKLKAKTDWENDKFEWFDIDKLPSPLHFGFKSVLPTLKKYLKTK